MESIFYSWSQTQVTAKKFPIQKEFLESYLDFKHTYVVNIQKTFFSWPESHSNKSNAPYYLLAKVLDKYWSPHFTILSVPKKINKVYCHEYNIILLYSL